MFKLQTQNAILQLDLLVKNFIDRYYCTCKTEVRTVGCYAHVASVIWFFRYAKHQKIIKYFSTKLLLSAIDSGNRELPEY